MVDFRPAGKVQTLASDGGSIKYDAVATQAALRWASKRAGRSWAPSWDYVAKQPAFTPIP